jgi:3-methylcrotonyl-CoA carboxylase beta subunit
MRHLVEQLKKLEDRLRAGGGPAKIERQHRAGKMAARERIAALLDPGTPFLEIGLLLAYDQYDGEAPGLGSVTGIGEIEGRYAVIIAGDATVKAGSWWPETVTKGLRAQEIAMRNRVPGAHLHPWRNRWSGFAHYNTLIEDAVAQATNEHAFAALDPELDLIYSMYSI